MVIENKIDYSEIINIIKEGLFYVIDNDEMGSYDDLQILISNEQFYVRQREEGKLSPNTLYFVVKFSPAAVDYGVTVLPLTILAISEQNRCELCQKLLQDFTTMANMEMNSSATIQQFYESPAVTSNFNEMFEGFRSVLTVPGTFVISASANPFTLEWYNPATYVENGQTKVKGWSEVYFINGSLGSNFQPEPKLFYSTNNFTRSIVTMGSVTFNISTVLLDDDGFLNEMLKFITKKNTYTIDTDPTSSTYLQKIDRTGELVDVNKKLIFRLTFKNEDGLTDYFKIANIDIQQVLKKIPMITLVFTN